MPPDKTSDSAPLTAGQLCALAAAVRRELGWGMRAADRELRGWRVAAEAIPDPRLRADALQALDHKRGHAVGAALFTTLPARRDRGLLRTLVAYETMIDYLDNVSERHPGRENGLQLHRALADAVDPGGPVRDWYRHHPECDDGGYLAGLVGACRAGCRTLPSFELVRPLLARDARRSVVLGLNHEPDPACRDDALSAWAAVQRPASAELTWFELSAAASATMTVLVLLALATDPWLRAEQVDAVHAAYWPWVSLATTMLDSWVDMAEDERAGHHSYVAHYGDVASALPRVAETIGRGIGTVRALPAGHRHAVIVGCMVALYLSQDAPADLWGRRARRQLVHAGGSLTRVLMPVLRTWRVAYGQCPPPMPARE